MTHWKILRDPYLRPLAERRGEEAVWASGFFFDDDPDDAPLDDVDWRCTRVPKRAVTGERPAVLLSTGAFCPVHDGHLAMMEHARTAALAAGYDVLGGYLSPGHDAYVGPKCGAAAIPASERVRLCAEAVKNSEWLSVDPWEALHCRVAVNFTDVTARLRAYLRAHVDPRVEVIFVCGGDNARFALAFAEEGACAVVARPGSEPERARFMSLLAGHPRVLWVDGSHPAASRHLRAPVWTSHGPDRLVLRLEDARAVHTLGLDGFDDFQRRLRALLEAEVAVRVAPLAEPRDEASVISLDAMLPAAHTLAMSRRYALGGYELMGYDARPGADALDAQVARIPAGRYTLRDDDRVTGGTLDAARALLPPSVHIEATSLSVPRRDDEDVADSRDFLLGADHGGLVVTLPGGAVARAPYALPYVDPAVRCCVPAHRAMAFSASVWALNREVFTRSPRRVRDLPAATRALVGWMGDDTPLAEVCAWHEAQLRRRLEKGVGAKPRG